MPLPSKGAWGAWEYTLVSGSPVDDQGNKMAILMRMGGYRLPSAVYEIPTTVHGPWFLDVADGDDDPALTILRVAKKSRFIPILSRRLALRDSAVRIVLSTRVAVPKGCAAPHVREHSAAIGVALASLARAKDADQEREMRRFMEELSRLDTTDNGVVVAEIAILEFPASSESTSKRLLWRHPVLLIPQHLLGPTKGYEQPCDDSVPHTSDEE